MPEKPNILLIVIDSVRADRFSCYGHDQPTTPNIDAIAEEGARFNAAYSESTWTLPVCFTLMTGLTPREHGGEDHRMLPDGMPTIAGALTEAGYATIGLSGNDFFGPRCGLDRGFGSFGETALSARWNQIFVKYAARRMAMLDAGGKALSDDLVAAIGEADGPWCGMLWLNDAHHPYTAPKPFATRFCRDHVPWPRRWKLWERMRRMPTLASTATERDLVDISGIYNGGVAYEDMLVGRVREQLESRGLWDNTVVIIVADHGDMLGERGLMGHGREADIYDPLIKVPLVASGPGFSPTPGGSNALVQLADVTRTMASVAGLPPEISPTAAKTVDLREAAGGEGRPHAIIERKPFSAHSLEGVVKRNPEVDFDPHLRHMTASVKDGYKLILREGGEPELYCLSDDPEETNDLAASEPARASGMIDLITQWQHEAKLHPAAEAAATDDSAIVEKRLQDLGYF